MIGIAQKLDFQRLDWMEMHIDDLMQKNVPILINSNGQYTLGCYLSVEQNELSKVKYEDPVEALWVLGPLIHSKPLINDEYFYKFVTRFNAEVRKYQNN